MTRSTALPLSLTDAAAAAHLADLRADAERHRVVRAARRRRGPAWPASVVAALRESISAGLPGSRLPRGSRRATPCPTC